MEHATKSITIRLTQSQLAKLHAKLAQASARHPYRRITLSDLIRDALTRSLTNTEPTQPTHRKVKQ
jgi:hypothetical protein